MIHGERHSGRFGELFARLGKGPVVKTVQQAVLCDVARAVRGEDRAECRIASEIWMEIFEERAAIMEYEGRMTRAMAEDLAREELTRAEADKWANDR